MKCIEFNGSIYCISGMVKFGIRKIKTKDDELSHIELRMYLIAPEYSKGDNNKYAEEHFVDEEVFEKEEEIEKRLNELWPLININY